MDGLRRWLESYRGRESLLGEIIKCLNRRTFRIHGEEPSNR